MSHFVILDDSNVITNVIVIADADCLDSESNESEAVGVSFCTALLGAGNYKQCSYNSTFRKQMAVVGGTYNTSENKFVHTKPHASWVLNADLDWVAPNDIPANSIQEGGDHKYYWNEDNYQADNSTGWVDLGV